MDGESEQRKGQIDIASREIKKKNEKQEGYKKKKWQ